MSRDASRLVRGALGGPRLRGALAVTGIAVGVLLVLVLVATYRSVSVAVAGYVGQRRVDLWVAPRGTNNLIRSSGVMPASVSEAVAAVAGVREAAPLLRGFVAARANGGTLTLLAMGHRAPGGVGGPPRIVRGRGVAGAGEVVLDRAAAYRLGVDAGDAVTLNGRSLRVVGVSAETNLMATQFAFVAAPDAEHLSGFAGLASFVAVSVHPGADPDAVARDIRARVPDVDVMTRAAFVENNVAEVGAGFRPMQVLVSAVGLTAAAMLVALLVQATVDDRRRDIALLFALGASSGAVARALLARVLALVAAGTLLGVAGAALLGIALGRWVPTVELSLRAGDPFVAALMVGAASLAAGVVPLARLRGVDPAEAFRP